MKNLVLIMFICMNILSFGKAYKFSRIENLFIMEIGGEVVSKIYEDLGYEIEIKSYPANRAARELNESEVDGEIMRAFLYGDSYPELIRVPTSFFALNSTAYVRTDSGIKIKTTADLKDYRVGIIRGIKLAQVLAKDARVITTASNPQQLFEMLERDRVDVILTDTLNGEVHRQKMNLQDKVTNNSLVLREVKFYHYLHQSNAEIVDKINNKIIEMKESGKLEKLIEEIQSTVLAELLSSNK